jgi:Uma2 family endonuclease
MTAPTLPITPDDGWTLDNLPDNLPKHTELIRGVLVMSPQKIWHLRTVDFLVAQLRTQLPIEYDVIRETAVKRSQRSAPEPDVLVVNASVADNDASVLLPQDVALVGEVISPESEERDREDKPLLYAAMGIPTFWLVERGADDAPIVHEHHLYGGSYQLKRTHIGRLKTEIPFSIDIALEPQGHRGQVG